MGSAAVMLVSDCDEEKMNDKNGMTYSLNNIAGVYFDQQKYAAAIEFFETATAVKPTDASAHYWTAKCLEKLGQSDKAINAYQLAFNLDNSLSEASEAISRINAAKK